MWELNYKESWALKNRCFGLWCWRRFLRVPWTARRSNQSILKEISPGCSLQRLLLKLKSNSLATWCLERLKAAGEADNRGWDGCMTSPNQWTWVWGDSGSWWWTRWPGLLRFMGSQRVRYDWVTELNWTEDQGKWDCIWNGQVWGLLIFYCCNVVVRG